MCTLSKKYIKVLGKIVISCGYADKLDVKIDRLRRLGSTCFIFIIIKESLGTPNTNCHGTFRRS